MAANPKNISLQERALARAQKELERAERIREQMAKQVELEMKRLEQLREGTADFTRPAGTHPSLTSAAPAQFQSQYDQYNDVLSKDRLYPLSNGMRDAFDFADKLKVPDTTGQTYHQADRDMHWTTLETDPGTNVYASVYYLSAKGERKEYEYEVEATALPLKVGDLVQAPVHHQGHPGQRPGILAGHDMRAVVTDIYSKEKFHPYHDGIK